MRRHVANPGNRKWYSDHLTELQSEALKAVESMLNDIDDCIISGVEVINYDPVSHTAELTAGYVWLTCADNQKRIMPYTGGDTVSFKAGDAMNYVESDFYIVPEMTEIDGEYQNPVDTTIINQYSASVNEYVSPPVSGININRINLPRLRKEFSRNIYEPAFTKNTAFNKDFGTTFLTVAEGNHNHSGVYEPAFTKNTAFNKDFGTTFLTVAEGNHNHSGVYEPVFKKLTAFNKNFGTSPDTVAEGNHNHDSDYSDINHNHVGSWEYLTLLNGFTEAASSLYPSLRGRLIDGGSNLQLHGYIDGRDATSNLIATLPADKRPLHGTFFDASYSYNKEARLPIQVETSGDVNVVGVEAVRDDVFYINAIVPID